MKTIKLEVSDKQLFDFLPKTKINDIYTIYECSEIPHIYFLGSENTNAENEPFEDLIDDCGELLRIISNEKEKEINTLLENCEIDY